MRDRSQVGTASRWAVAESARSRAVALARAEAAQLAESLGPSLTALAAIQVRNRRCVADSARVRALGLERLPDSDYLAHTVELLCAELDAAHSRRKWLLAVRRRADEVDGLLRRAVELTATIDIAGELELSLGLVTAVQAGARAGLSSVSRLREHLDAVECGPVEVGRAMAPASEAVGQPTRSAQWLVRLASRLLPPGGRHRYLEEFSAELSDLAEAGSTPPTQRGHALRLVLRAWSLRRVLAGASRPVLEPDRVRVQTRVDGATGRPVVASPPGGVRAAVQRWRARRDARRIVRVQARLSRRENAATLPVTYRHRAAQQVYGRGGIRIRYRRRRGGPPSSLHPDRRR